LIPVATALGTDTAGRDAGASAGGLNHLIRASSLKVLNEQLIQFSKEEFDSMPKVGDMAPDFELKSHLAKDKKVKLSDFRGQKNVVIAFYPLAWTPV
jgi:hypothetical protein